MERRAVRRISATEARVHFGELLRSLAEGDVVIEKGGLAVARLTGVQHGWNAGYVPSSDEEEEAAMRSGSNGIAKTPEANGVRRMEAAARAGWIGMNVEATVASIYRWREEGSSRSFEFDAADDDANDDTALPDRFGRLYQGHAPRQRVADADDSEYGA